MNGAQANNVGGATNAAVNFGSAILGAIGANRYATDTRFKHDAVVLEETDRDNLALVATAATGFLVLVVVIILLVK